MFWWTASPSGMDSRLFGFRPHGGREGVVVVIEKVGVHCVGLFPFAEPREGVPLEEARRTERGVDRQRCPGLPERVPGLAAVPGLQGLQVQRHRVFEGPRRLGWGFRRFGGCRFGCGRRFDRGAAFLGSGGHR